MNAEKPRRRRTRDPVCSLLNELRSPYGFGWKKPGGVDRFSNDYLIRLYNTYGFMPSPKKGRLYSHFAGQDTLYMCGDGRYNTPRMLAMVDIDCHSRGTARSARAFANWLADNHLPRLYHEPSTHGLGRHGYFLLSKEKCNARAVCTMLSRLDKALKKLLGYFLATHSEHDVETVEIKGAPPVITWEPGDRPQIRYMKSGTFAKVPREILDRFEEFQDTTVLTFDDIRRLERFAEGLEIPPTRSHVARRGGGSTPGHPVPQEELEAIHGPYLEYARTWVGTPLGTSSRAKVEALDVAIGLAIVKVCSAKPNEDGSMPTARIKAIWDRLFQDGEVDRAFDYHRWRVVRDLIEGEGGLEMVDRRYYTGFADAEGRTIKGKAARWHMAAWLVEKLDEILGFGFRVEEEDQGGGTLLEPEEDGATVLMRGQEQGGTLLEPEDGTPQGAPGETIEQGQGGTLLEQGGMVEETIGFDDDWIVDFRAEAVRQIGLIWCGTYEMARREAG